METKWSVDWIWDTLLIDFLIPFIVHFVSFEHHFFSSIKKKCKPMHEPVGEYVLSLSLSFAMNMFRVSRKSVEKYHYEFQCANPILLLYQLGRFQI